MYLIAILVALGIGAILLMSLDVNPFQYYGKMFTMGMVDNHIAYKTVENYIKMCIRDRLQATHINIGYVSHKLVPIYIFASKSYLSASHHHHKSGGHNYQ